MDETRHIPLRQSLTSFVNQTLAALQLDSGLLQDLLECLKGLEPRVKGIAQIEEKKRELDAVATSLQALKVKLSDFHVRIAQKQREVAERVEHELLSRSQTPMPDTVRLYACFIAGSVAAPIDYAPHHRELPWAFGSNKPESGQAIETTSLYHHYKGNRYYAQCPLPHITYSSVREEHVPQRHSDPHTFTLEALEHLVVSATCTERQGQGGQPRVIYTDDGSEPTLYNCRDCATEAVTVTHSCTLKFRVVQSGRIDSEVVTLFVRIREDAVQEPLIHGRMQRPVYVPFESDEEVMSSVDLHLDEEKFASWHENLAQTPRD